MISSMIRPSGNCGVKIMSKTEIRDAYGKALVRLALSNPDVVVVDVDVSKPIRSAEFEKVAPERHFNFGIAEGNMMGVAAGLALSGKIPFANSFAIFAAGRGYEQIRNSIASPHLNVKIVGSHAGFSPRIDGASHQCLEDIALMRVLPGMTVIQPCDERETIQAIQAAAEFKGPVYIRLSRSRVEDVYDDDYRFELGKAVVLHEGESAVVMFASGTMVQRSLQAVELLKRKGIDPTVINVHTIKPLDQETVLRFAEKASLIVTLEEHSVIGGLGGAIAELLAAHCPRKQLFIGVHDQFGETGTVEQLFEKHGLTAEKIAESIEKATL